MVREECFHSDDNSICMEAGKAMSQYHKYDTSISRLEQVCNNLIKSEERNIRQGVEYRILDISNTYPCKWDSPEITGMTRLPHWQLILHYRKLQWVHYKTPLQYDLSWKLGVSYTSTTMKCWSSWATMPDFSTRLPRFTANHQSIHAATMVRGGAHQ